MRMKKNFFGKNTEEWNWKDFNSTKGFPVSTNLLDWVVGQDEALTECKLCLDEWIQKLLHLKRKKWWKDFEDPYADKPPPSEWLPSGPFLLMLGDPGTGKSLIGRALSVYMTKLYKKHKIELYDILCWMNKSNPSEPCISIHPAGEGEILRKSVFKKKKPSWLRRNAIKLLLCSIAGIGGLITGATVYNIYKLMSIHGLSFLDALLYNAYLLSIGLGMVGVGVMIYIFSNMMGGIVRQGGYSIGGSARSNAPKLLVDNTIGRAPFIDATGHGSSQLYGSIAWDPYQTGGLGTPEHQRVSVGDVHRAHLGVLYIDEIKNLHGLEATTLLTVLEDGQLPIALRSQFHGGDTAAMSVSTEPVPCMNFLIAAGNLDSIPRIHSALMDRIIGYGKVVYMNNYMDNTVENRRKCVQFMAQEIKRFNLLPFNQEACIEVIMESSRISGETKKLSTKFRPLISILKTASILAFNEGKKIVEKANVKEAIDVHCKTIQLQILEKYAEQNKLYRIVNPKSKPIIGQVYGMSVSHFDTGDSVGAILPIKASIEKLSKNASGYFRVTGVKTKDNSWVQNSISKVSTVIQQRYKHKKKFGIHIDFAQNLKVDGPSAGVTMALALISIFDKKPVRQDTAVTGEINISIEGKVIITPIGGVRQKILAAQEAGFKRVLIPKRNYELNVDLSDYKIKIIPCETLEDYIKEILVKK